MSEEAGEEDISEGGSEVSGGEGIAYERRRKGGLGAMGGWSIPVKFAGRGSGRACCENRSPASSCLYLSSHKPHPRSLPGLR